jgi:hypothetical protein
MLRAVPHHKLNLQICVVRMFNSSKLRHLMVKTVEVQCFSTGHSSSHLPKNSSMVPNLKDHKSKGKNDMFPTRILESASHKS